MVNTELRQGPVAVLTSWMRNERHTSAMRSALTVCVRSRLVERDPRCHFE